MRKIDYSKNIKKYLNAKDAPNTTHKCVDCGTPTPDRRCDKCRAKWNAKHGVSSNRNAVNEDWAEL